MIIKRYLVKDMNEAMVKIRYELGKDAIIVSNRWIRQRGWANLFKKKVLEVTAAVDKKKPKETDIREFNKEKSREQEEELKLYHDSKHPYHEELAELKALVHQLLEERPMGTSRPVKTKEPIQEDAATQRVISSNSHSEESITDIFDTLELDEEVVGAFTAYCIENNIYTNINRQVFRQYIEDFMDGHWISDLEVNNGILVFIGPTGVGKTTTIAKIAAKESLNNGKKVGLITLDTYRIGAAEQLKTYGNILNIPMETVLTKSDLSKAIHKLSYCDLILVDSTGRSAYNTEQLRETKDLLTDIKDKKNILVVSSTIRKNDLKSIMYHYREIGFDYVIMTKIDETKCYGNILNAAYYAEKPLLYITTGQNVPDDIIHASKDIIFKYIFQEGELQWIRQRI